MVEKHKALVTGGAGFIGSHLSEALLGRGYEVVALDDLSTGSLDNISHLVGQPNFRYVSGSITNQAVVEELVEESSVVFHLAAAVGVELIVRNPVHAIETNILGTREVLNIARRYNRKVLLASTSEIYGKNVNVPFKEDDDRVLGSTTKGRWSYSTSKAVDEFLALAYHRQMGLPVVIFRLFNTIGPRQTGRYGMVVPRFVRQALNHEPLTIYGDGQQSRCFCDVSDAVRAIIGLAESSKAVGEVFNIGATEELSIVELAKRVLQITGVDVREDTLNALLKFVPYEEAYEAEFEDMRRRVPDTTKIKNAIGWEPQISLDESLKKIVGTFSLSREGAKTNG